MEMMLPLLEKHSKKLQYYYFGFMNGKVPHLAVVNKLNREKTNGMWEVKITKLNKLIYSDQHQSMFMNVDQKSLDTYTKVIEVLFKELKSLLFNVTKIPGIIFHFPLNFSGKEVFISHIKKFIKLNYSFSFSASSDKNSEYNWYLVSKISPDKLLKNEDKSVEFNKYEFDDIFRNHKEYESIHIKQKFNALDISTFPQFGEIVSGGNQTQWVSKEEENQVEDEEQRWFDNAIKQLDNIDVVDFSKLINVMFLHTTSDASPTIYNYFMNKLYDNNLVDQYKAANLYINEVKNAIKFDMKIVSSEDAEQYKKYIIKLLKYANESNSEHYSAIVWFYRLLMMMNGKPYSNDKSDYSYLFLKDVHSASSIFNLVNESFTNPTILDRLYMYLDVRAWKIIEENYKENTIKYFDAEEEANINYIYNFGGMFKDEELVNHIENYEYVKALSNILNASYIDAFGRNIKELYDEIAKNNKVFFGVRTIKYGLDKLYNWLSYSFDEFGKDFKYLSRMSFAKENAELLKTTIDTEDNNAFLILSKLMEKDDSLYFSLSSGSPLYDIMAHVNLYVEPKEFERQLDDIHNTYVYKQPYSNYDDIFNPDNKKYVLKIKEEFDNILHILAKEMNIDTKPYDDMAYKLYQIFIQDSDISKKGLNQDSINVLNYASAFREYRPHIPFLINDRITFELPYDYFKNVKNPKNDATREEKLFASYIIKLFDGQEKFNIDDLINRNFKDNKEKKEYIDFINEFNIKNNFEENEMISVNFVTGDSEKEIQVDRDSFILYLKKYIAVKKFFKPLEVENKYHDDIVHGRIENKVDTLSSIKDIQEFLVRKLFGAGLPVDDLETTITQIRENPEDNSLVDKLAIDIGTERDQKVQELIGKLSEEEILEVYDHFFNLYQHEYYIHRVEESELINIQDEYKNTFNIENDGEYENELLDEHINLLQKHYDETYTDSEMRAALYKYTQDSSINQLIRSRIKEPSDYNYYSEEFVEMIKVFASESTLTPTPMIVGRGSDHDGWLSNKLAGDLIFEPSFFSTTISTDTMRNYSNNQTGKLYLIYLPAGTRAIYVNPISAYDTEEEIILAPGSIFKILSIENGKLYSGENTHLIRRFGIIYRILYMGNSMKSIVDKFIENTQNKSAKDYITNELKDYMPKG